SCIRSDHESPKEDKNSVFFSSSTGNGQSWTEPVLVSRSGRKEADYTQLLTKSDGHIHLLWAKRLNADFVTETIWHARSHDGGKSWSTPIDLETEHPATIFKITADSQDRFHLVYTSLAQNKLRTYYKMWDKNHWKPET